jgi:hypothetical protein
MNNYIIFLCLGVTSSLKRPYIDSILLFWLAIGCNMLRLRYTLQIVSGTAECSEVKVMF